VRVAHEVQVALAVARLLQAAAAHAE
jgi:hypothetical protein